MQLNGQGYEVADGIQTIAHLLEHLNLGQRVVVVEHNRKVLQKEDHPQAVLADGDVVEIVHFVGGG
nr:sulfur carrier protein ThiS [Lihuaxuella thermophila]